MIVGLGHVARCGKDTFAAALVERHGFTRVAFADALREFVYRTHPDVATIVDRVGWENAKIAHASVRQTLIDVGNSARQIMGEDVLIRAVARQIEPYRDYVITDVRYPNEVEFVQLCKYTMPFDRPTGVTVRIDRPGVEAGPDVADQALVGFDGWDYVIDNCGSISYLAEQADDFVWSLRNDP